MINAPANTAEAPIYTVAKCLNELIVNKNADDALEKVVEWLSVSLDINRCFIFKSKSNSSIPEFYRSFNYGKKESLRQTSIARLKGAALDLNDYPEVRNVLEKRLSFKISVNNIISRPLLELLEKVELMSVLVVPIFSAGSVWGFICFGDTKNNRTWRNSEQELQSLAAAIGVAFSAKDTTTTQSETNETFNSKLPSRNEASWEINLIQGTIKIADTIDLLDSYLPGEHAITFPGWYAENAHPEDAPRVIKKYEDFLLKDNGASDEDVYRLMKKDTNSYGWVLSKRRLIKDENGVAISIIGSTKDLTYSNEVASEYNKKQEQFNFLVQSLGQVIFQLRNDGEFVSVNNTWTDLSGFNVNETIGSSFFNYFESGLQNENSSFGCLLKGCTDAVDLQLPLIRKNGQRLWVRLLAKIIKDENGNRDGIFGSLENINDKYNADLVLRESNDKLNTILNSSKEIILTINLDENIIENVNDAISVLGYQPKDWVGMNYKNWTHYQRGKFHELMKLALRSELQVSNQRITFANKDNTELIPFEFSTSIFTFKNSKYLLCVLRDIGERVAYEKNLHAISNQLTHLISNIDDVYAIYDLKTQSYEFVSDNVSNLYDCSKNDFISKGLIWHEIVHVEDASGILQEVHDIIDKKNKGEFFYRINTSRGETKMLFEKITVGKDKEGNPEKLYIVKTDYTHIENAEQSLIETERKFKFISENISDFISIHDPDWNFTYASPSIRNILGYEPEEILGLGGFDLVHADDVIRTLDNALEPIILEKKETQFRYRMRAKNNEFKWVETYSKPVINAQGDTSSIISSTRDVTDQVNAETMLKTSEERYRLLSENSNDVIAIFDLDGSFNYVSPSCLQVLEYTSQELVGKSPVELFVKKKDRRALAKTGLEQMAKDKESRKFIQQVYTKSGKVKSLEVWVQPIIKNGEVVSFQAASHDVTEREQLLSELEHALAKERELNELRAMFVSTASHQFRTPLTVIQSGVEIMEMYLENLPNEKQARFQRQFDKIQGEVERLHYLMSDILLLGRANAARTPFVPQTGDIVQFCKSIIDEKYNNIYKDDRKIIFSLEGTETMVDFDPKLIGHAIENIINNAYKYSTEGNLFLKVAFINEEVQIDITDQGNPENNTRCIFYF